MLPATQAIAPRPVSVGGLLQIKSLAAMQEEQRRADKAAAVARNNASHMTSLAAYCRTLWMRFKEAKEQTVEPRLLDCVRQRDGKYADDELAAIKAQGGSEIYMMLSSNKARAASSWIRDVIGGSGSERPWTISPTPVPTMPPEVAQAAFAQMQQELQQYAAMGLNPSPQELHEFITARKAAVLNQLREEAEQAADQMANQLEDQLVEGGFRTTLSQFIDDLVTFPYATIKGPVVRRSKRLEWVPVQGGASAAQVVDYYCLEWERVDPFMLYWSPEATCPDDGDMIQRHRLSRGALHSLIGVEGYDDGAIRAVLEEYGRGGLHEWLQIDVSKAAAENKHYTAAMSNPGGLIDALQVWASVQGKMLREWGLSEQEVPDELADYSAEVWVIGNWVIKATLNADPLGRKPYYKTSYEVLPGSWMGNGVMDLVRDCQRVCNATARSLVSNMGIASGPMVWVNTDRLADGENITQLYPWKIFQTTADMMGSSAPPIDFFQPSSMAGELMGIYEKFSVLADEYSGVPRYMTGDSPAGGAGRTASGMSMLMTNAGKSIKQVVGNIDVQVMEPLLERLIEHNRMQNPNDPIMAGDIRLVARGATNMVVKDAAQVRRNEFMQLALQSPVVQQVIGMEGVAHLLRETAKTLDMNPDKVVPDPVILKARMLYQQLMQRLQAEQQLQADMAAQGGEAPSGGPSKSGQALADGAPVTDNFSPPAA